MGWRDSIRSTLAGTDLCTGPRGVGPGDFRDGRVPARGWGT